MTDSQTCVTDRFHHDVVAGLSDDEKNLPSKYFYDARGCELFEEICRLEEYYLTRTELDIMTRHADEMSHRLGEGCMLIELGSGSSRKTRLLLDHLVEPAAYVPVDIAEDHLHSTAKRLSKTYPHIEILPVCADFFAQFDLPLPQTQPRRRAVYFPGSTIGNFEPADSHRLLANIARLCGPDGELLIGIDLKKDEAILEAAYNDREGVTAEFNLNLLRRINRELDADFDVSQFTHRAVYDKQEGRVEMQLVSEGEQTVKVDGEQFQFDKGEWIRTEYSHKYDVDEFAGRVSEHGFVHVKTWTDEKRRVGVMLFSASP